MIRLQQKTKGVTLLEVMLVLAIASSMLVMMLNYTTQKADELRRDKTVLQAQQILNAGMSYYVTHSAWPVTQCSKIHSPQWSPMGDLQPSYLPTSLVRNPYGNPYLITCSNVPEGGGFYISIEANNEANAAVIAGRLPLAYRTNSFADWPPTACTSGSDCINVVANVNIPGQNLNNARSVNFASVYYSGSCVPAPSCPPNMKPDILVMPGSVSGVNTQHTPSCVQQPDSRYGYITVCTGQANPVTSFTAYAMGGASGGPVDPNTGPYGCRGMTTPTACIKDANGAPFPSDGTLYWRVCLSVSTDQGLVDPAGTAKNQGYMMGTLVAMTRCVPNQGNEDPAGSIDVWQR